MKNEYSFSFVLKISKLKIRMQPTGRDDDDYEEPVYDDGFETKYYLKVADAQSRVSIRLFVILLLSRPISLPDKHTFDKIK